VAAASNDLADTPLAVMLAGKPIVLFRSADGRVVALEDRCVHRHAPLSLGRTEPSGLRCMYHGLLFAPDGRCIEIPGQQAIPAKAVVPAYPAAERHGWIWVWQGDPALAEAELLPPAIAGDHPGWITAQSHLDYAANYGLLIDNLLDFSHLSFVHAKSFRADPKWATIRPTITPLPRGLRISRWIPQAPALMSARALAGQVVDTWQSYDFLAPGILVMETCYCAPGTAELSGFGKPASGVLVRNGAAQAVTPMSGRTSRYFFAVALPVEGADQATCDKILQVSGQAFQEDKLIIEAQQQRIDQAPGRQPLPTAADGAITLFHRVLRRLAGTEAVTA
jgi:vanillate O-demethylase monooxygenase subunit